LIFPKKSFPSRFDEFAGKEFHYVLNPFVTMRRKIVLIFHPVRELFIICSQTRRWLMATKKHGFSFFKVRVTKFTSDVEERIP